MGGAKHYSQCLTSHEDPIERKCLINQLQEDLSAATGGDSLDQARNSILSEQCINEEQAVNHLQNPKSSDSSHTSAGTVSDNTHSKATLLAAH